MPPFWTGSVSYTHLDVYKRQAQSVGHKTRYFISTKIIGVGIVAWVKPPLSRFQPILLHQRHGPGTVSYTHLGDAAFV